MVEWYYVKDVKRDKVDEFCEGKMKEFPNRIYKIASARSNIPDMIAVYYRKKLAEE
jgi:hypothetical protein